MARSTPDDVAALAERLGVGERQLRRLFHQHVGASPIAVAQTRRVLLAKQLIHETQLPMTRGCAGRGIRQRPPVQRDLPEPVSAGRPRHCGGRRTTSASATRRR